MIICRNCSQTFNNDETYEIKSIKTCPKCERDEIVWEKNTQELTQLSKKFNEDVIKC
jgi:predicted Zn-ribbon and HTH transcriptional regulator